MVGYFYPAVPIRYYGLANLYHFTNLSVFVAKMARDANSVYDHKRARALVNGHQRR